MKCMTRGRQFSAALPYESKQLIVTQYPQVMFLSFFLLYFFSKTHSFMCLFEVIYVVCTLFENIKFANYLQFAFAHPTVSYQFNLDNDEQLHIDSYSP